MRLENVKLRCWTTHNDLKFIQPWDNTEIWICDVAVDGDKITFTDQRKVGGAFVH